VIASSARKSSVSNALITLGAEDLHLWLCRREAGVGSDHFRREVLSRYASVAPADWRFSTGAHGKPALANPPTPLVFNLSSSGAWLALAVSSGVAVGLDLEYCDPRRQVLKLARRCFSSAELAELQGCAEPDRVARFYDYWTLKEAGIKARGGSLALELESTGFGLDFPTGDNGSTPIGTITALAPERGLVDFYCLLDPAVSYRLALCGCTGGRFNPRLRLFEQLAGGQVRDLPTSLRAVSVACP
jgi:hypothetical protein